MTPTDEDLLAAVTEVVRTELRWEGSLSPSDRIVETLALDSLRLLTLVVAIEDRFRIRLEEQDEAAIETLGDLLDTIRRKRAGRPANAR